MAGFISSSYKYLKSKNKIEKGHSLMGGWKLVISVSLPLSTFSWSLTFQSLCNNTSASCCCMFFTFGNVQGSFICFFFPLLSCLVFCFLSLLSLVKCPPSGSNYYDFHYLFIVIYSSSFNYLQKAIQCFNINLLYIWELLYILDCRAESRHSTAGWMYPHWCHLLLEHPLNYQIKASKNVPSILEL